MYFDDKNVQLNFAYNPHIVEPLRMVWVGVASQNKDLLNKNGDEQSMTLGLIQSV